MRISLNVSTKPHLCWCSLKSSDLDTSDDFSEELDRSHGFFTASGGGTWCEGHPHSQQQCSFERRLPVEFCRPRPPESSCTREKHIITHQLRPKPQALLLTTYFIGFLRRFSSEENKRIVSILSQFVTVDQRTSQEIQKEHE